MRHRPAIRTAWNTYQMHHGPNMTPMVDVVMVILIFFMATASVLGPDWFLKTSIPKMAAADTPPATEPPEVLRLEVTRAGAEFAVSCVELNLNGASVANAAAALKSKREGPDGERIVVLIAPADDVAYQAIIALHEVCERLGITKVGVVPK